MKMAVDWLLKSLTLNLHLKLSHQVHIPAFLNLPILIRHSNPSVELICNIFKCPPTIWIYALLDNRHSDRDI